MLKGLSSLVRKKLVTHYPTPESRRLQLKKIRDSLSPSTNRVRHIQNETVRIRLIHYHEKGECRYRCDMSLHTADSFTKLMDQMEIYPNIDRRQCSLRGPDGYPILSNACLNALIADYGQKLITIKLTNLDEQNRLPTTDTSADEQEKEPGTVRHELAGPCSICHSDQSTKWYQCKDVKTCGWHFYLCEKCENSNLHAQHEMRRLPNPSLTNQGENNKNKQS